MKIDEYAPEATPINKANAKSFNVEPPNSSSAITGSRVQEVVINDRVRTSDIERFTTCENAALGIRGMFSRTRSNTMIVSYSEYPRIVNNAATVSAVTTRPVNAYTPAVINKSCIKAIKTGTVNFHANRNATYNEITNNEMMIATTALLVTVDPNAGPA